MGESTSDTTITHCFWPSDTECDEVNGTGSPNITATFAITSLNDTTTDELNEYAERMNSTWSRWGTLHFNGGKIKDLDQEEQISGLLKSLPAL